MNHATVSRPKGARPFRDMTMDAARAIRPANFVVKDFSDCGCDPDSDGVAETGAGVIEILDEIGGWGVYAAEVIPVLRLMDSKYKSIVIRINSYGGDVFEGLAIANTIADLKAETTVEVIGVAASIASIVAIAADKNRIRKNAQMMIHRPWALTWGESEDLRSVASHLDMIEGQLIDTYTDRSAGKKDRAAFAAAVAAGTWMTGENAVEWGLADEVISREATAVKIEAANLEAAGIKNAPANLIAETVADAAVAAVEPRVEPAPEPVIEESAPVAEKIEDADANAPAAVANNAAYDDHQVAAIRAAFARTRRPGLADEAMAAGLSVEQAKAKAFDLLAEEDTASAIETAIVGTEGSEPPAAKTAEQVNAEIRARQFAEFQQKKR